MRLGGCMGSVRSSHDVRILERGMGYVHVRWEASDSWRVR